jgi:hypothetical protein
MPNNKSVGVAFSDPELTAGTTITGAIIDSTSRIASNIATGYFETTSSATITTAAGDTDAYLIADAAGVLTAVRFSATTALATSATDYITWTITNLGQAGSGSAAMLAATAVNSTQTTGGSAIAANTLRNLTLNGTAANLVVAVGDRLRIRATVTAATALANTVTFPVYNLTFNVS